MLETIDLTKKFGGLTAVNDVNFEVKEGELRGIVGPNGSGKTTLINLITGYLTPTKGKVIFNGENIAGLQPEAIARRGIGRIFQITNIFLDIPIYDNIWVAGQINSKSRSNPFINFRKLEDVEKRVEEVLRVTGLSLKANEIASNCSYGEQRLLEIGIVLAMDPKLMLLDEPTAGLSHGERQQILNVIKKLSKAGKTMMVIEHSMEVIAKLASIVMVLNRGKIIAEGTPSEIIENEMVQQIYIRG